jgi:hypothetical protein
MTRVGFITWNSKGFTLGAVAPTAAAPPVRRPVSATPASRAPAPRRRGHTPTKELIRR